MLILITSLCFSSVAAVVTTTDVGGTHAHVAHGRRQVEGLAQ